MARYLLYIGCSLAISPATKPRGFQMSKQAKQAKAKNAPAKSAAAPATTPPAAPAAKPAAAPAAPAAPARLRLPLPQAKTHNTNFVVLAAGAPVVAANLAGTTKGSNPKKARVYGYGNMANGGGVPKQAICVVVPGFTGVPANVNPGQWALLVKQAGVPVSTLYNNGITARTIRRAYRAGAVNFVAPAA
jgi:hypothetical protein